MSTLPPAPTRLAFVRWIDDAAVFPPGNAAVDEAWHAHLDLIDGGYGDLVGPLLVGVGHVDELAALAPAAPRPGGDLVDVSVIARAGTAVHVLLDAAHRLRTGAGSAVRLRGLELAHDGTTTWREALAPGLPLAVELPRTGWQDAMDDLGASAREGHQVVAKLRTQATAAASPPTAEELAAFFTGARERGLPVKLTGGLHHALPADVDGHHEHGFLNVLVAGRQVAGGAELDQVVATLTQTDPEVLVTEVHQVSRPEMDLARGVISSFGCCGVLDPLTDLVRLGLLPEAPPGP